MNNINELLQELDEQQEVINKKRQALIQLQPKIQDFQHDLSLSFGGYSSSTASIDFDYPGRSETVDLITHMKAGKWDKKVSGREGTIDYINKTLIPGIRLRIYAAEPPPSCKIVEVPEEIPAQPARTVMRKKVVCKERGLPAV